MNKRARLMIVTKKLDMRMFVPRKRNFEEEALIKMIMLVEKQLLY